LVLLSGVMLLTPGPPSDMFMLVNGCLAGGVLFLVLQSLTILWSIVPAWRRPPPTTAAREAEAGT
jgi:hypothetical protein